MNIQNKKEFSLPFFGRDLKFILSDIAGQANAALIMKRGFMPPAKFSAAALFEGKEDPPISPFFPGA